MVSGPYLQTSIESNPYSNNCGFFELRRQLSKKMTHHRGEMYCRCCLESKLFTCGNELFNLLWKQSMKFALNQKRTMQSTMFHHHQTTSQWEDLHSLFLSSFPPFIFILWISRADIALFYQDCGRYLSCPALSLSYLPFLLAEAWLFWGVHSSCMCAIPRRWVLA